MSHLYQDQADGARNNFSTPLDFDNSIHSQVKITNNIIESIFGRSPAQFINRLYFLLSDPNNGLVDKNGRRWIFNNYDEWSENLGISISQFKRNVKKLRDGNILLVKKLGYCNPRYRYSHSDRTNHYSLNMDVLLSLLNGAENLIGSPSNKQKRSLAHPKKQKRKYDPPPDDAETFIGSHEYPQKRSLAHDKIKNDTKNVPYDRQKASLAHLENGKNNHQLTMSQSISSQWSNVITENTAEIKKLIKLTKKIDFSVSVSMLDTWNRYVPLQRHEWSEAVHHKLVWAMDEFFGGDMARWNTFCRKVSNSPYHRGDVVEGHAVFRFDFLKNSLCEKVIGQIELVSEPEETLDDVEAICQEVALGDIENEEDEAVKAFKLAFVEEFGVRKYKSWMTAEKVQISCKDGIIVVRGIGKFTQDYVEREFGLFIKNYNTEDSPEENTPVESFKDTAIGEVGSESINSPSGHSKRLGSLLNAILKKEGKNG